MNILITGGKGFIGSAITSVLKQEHNILILDNWSYTYPGFCAIHRGNQGLQKASDLELKHRRQAAKYRDSLLENIEVFKSWSFKDNWNQKLKFSPNLIINCGSLSEAILSQYLEQFTYQSIVYGIDRLRLYYPSVPILHFSSSMSYGSWKGAIKEDGAQEPVDWYGQCKKDSEKYATPQDIIVRPMHVYGFGDGKFPMPMNIERQYKNNASVNVEEADCIYIKDLTIVIKKMIDNWVPGVYNLSSGYLRDKAVIKNQAKEILGFDIETVTKSGPTGKDRGTLDSSKLMKTFNWESKYKNYEETIKDYFNEYIKYNENNS